MIICDLDGVLSNFNYGAVQLLQDLDVPQHDHPTKPPTWDWLSGIGKRDADDELWRRIGETKNYWLNLPPLDSALGARDWMAFAAIGIPIVFVTSRGSKTVGWPIYKQTQFWLMENRFSPSYPSVLVVKDKAKLATNLYDVELIIEDKPNTCLAFAEAGIPVLMPRYQYNAHIEHEKITRYDDLYEGLKENGYAK